MTSDVRTVEHPAARAPGSRTVAAIMAPRVVTIAPGMPVCSARTLLREAGVRHLPVVDRGLLVGMVSDGDLRLAPTDGTPLRDIMTRTVFVLSPLQSVAAAARIFRERGFGAMPVLEGRRLVGIVSVKDVLAEISGETLVPRDALAASARC